ncbi:MAG: endonuclease/exonuclease/phosphatase family protein [Nocardioides sp.]
MNRHGVCILGLLLALVSGAAVVGEPNLRLAGAPIGNVLAPASAPAVLTAPVAPEGASGGAVVSLSAGGQSTCETRADGSAWCWGRNDYGQLGDRSTIGRSSPLQVPGSDWRLISTSGATTCAIKVDGTLWCWGLNNFGQVGVRRSRPRLKPVRVGTATWTSVVSGWGHTCGIQSSPGSDRARAELAGSAVPEPDAGSLWCWGQNLSGQLGVGSTRRHVARPTRVGPADDWASVTVGGWHTCATRVDYSAWCWGRNTFGQLGRDIRAQSSPFQVGKRNNWGTVTAGWGHTCATRLTGQAGSVRFGTGIKCWGYNDQGQLGDGTTTASAKPRLIGIERRWRSVSAGDANTCALDETGYTWCWGSNRYRQLGTSMAPRSRSAVPAAPGSMARLTSGWLHTCVAPATGSTRCWGNNEQGQLGAGTVARAQPVASGGARTAGPSLDRAAESRRWTDRGWDTMTLSEVARHAVQGRPAVGPTARYGGESSAGTDRSTGHNGSPPGRRAKPWKLRVMTFNVLGSQHTAPGGARPDFAPGRLRAEWSTNLIARKRASLIGMQEVQPDQLAAFESANPGRLAFYPGVSLGYPGAPQSVAWRRSKWSLVWQTTVAIPFVGTWRPQPVVRLRDRATGRELYWINAHFSPRGMERDRDRATTIVTKMVRRLQRDRLPIILTGDFNERREIFCKVTRRTKLRAANGGRNGGRGECRPPRGMRIDWIFASRGKLRRLRIDQGAAVRRITDHAVLKTKVVVR